MVHGDVAQLGRITTSGDATYYPLPTGITGPGGITTGPDGELWFTESDANQIGEAFFVSAGLTVSPPTGTVHGSLTFTGSGFAPNEMVSIYTSGIGSRVLAGATADIEGAFTATAAAPQSPWGPRIFAGAGQASGKLGAASFSVASKLVINPTSGPPGTLVTVKGYGFGSITFVSIDWHSPRGYMGQASADIEGTFDGSSAFTFTVPAGVAPGINHVLAVGPLTGERASAAFRVTN